MPSSILHSIRGKRNGTSTLHDIEAGIEDQIAQLRDEIASLASLVRKNAASQRHKLRDQAETGFDELISRGEDMLRDLQDGSIRGAREMRETVRRHPAATVAAAAVVGLTLAFLARRR
ncbi:MULTISPECIES: hypothetical protein [unclassified Sinorhizobium]|uniref:hypothetical protein n=1 Tax=unclassified Sinorhizobium TaxID=2613772 RepID=UPI003524A874